jgi:hypothetical protein
MKCSNPDCDRGLGLVVYRRGWFSKRRYCSNHCRNAFAVDAPNLLQRFVVSLIAFFALIVPLTLAMAVLAAPPARPEAPRLPGCDRSLADASVSVAAMQARLKSLSGVDSSEICTGTKLYFLEVVKARAVTALCKSGTERDRDLGRIDADVERTNEEIATRCL